MSRERGGLSRWFAVVIALALAGTAAAGCSSAATPEDSASVALPAALRQEERLLVPLTYDLDLDFDHATLAMGATASTLELRSGDRVTMKVDPNSSARLLPDPVLDTHSTDPTDPADLPGTRISAASWTSPAGTVLVNTTRPDRPQFLQNFTRGVAALPSSVASDLAAGRPIRPIVQRFVLGGHRFTRHVASQPIPASFAGLPPPPSAGLPHLQQVVELDDHVDGRVRIVEGGLDLALVPLDPQELVVFDSGGGPLVVPRQRRSEGFVLLRGRISPAP